MNEEVKDNDNQNSGNSAEELEILTKKATEYLDGWRRAKADYLNLKKESEGLQRQTIEYANAALVAELLPIYNHLKLAIEHKPPDLQDNSWVKGVEHIQSQFKDFFASLGIEEIKTVGEKFNPELHEAIETAVKEGVAPDMVYEQVSAGYTLHGKVITPALVKVST